MVLQKTERKKLQREKVKKKCKRNRNRERKKKDNNTKKANQPTTQLTNHYMSAGLVLRNSNSLGRKREKLG